MTEKEIHEYILKRLPGISYQDMWQIRNEFIYQFIPLDVAIDRYRRKKQFEKWEKSKNKRYYKVSMTNGGHKYVYMCQEMVESLYQSAYQAI